MCSECNEREREKEGGEGMEKREYIQHHIARVKCGFLPNQISIFETQILKSFGKNNKNEVHIQLNGGWDEELFDKDPLLNGNVVFIL